MTQRADLEAVVERCRDLLGRMHGRTVGQLEMELTLYNIVAFKLFGYAVNTFKSIYYLLPHTVYEQATILYRTLWETVLNLEWIGREPEARAGRFLRFTAVEHRRFIEARIRSARRADDGNAVLSLRSHLDAFEGALEQQLAQFKFRDRSGKVRWRDRFSAPSLQDVVREVGGEWLDEYDRDYLLGCGYSHGAPAAVLFPLYDTPDHQVAQAQDVERSAIVGAMAIRVMSRAYRRWLAARGEEDDEYLAALVNRVRESGCT